MVDGPPQIMLLAVNLHKHLVEVPPPLGIRSHMVDALPADLGGEHWSKPVPPETHCLVANVDPAIGQQIFDVPK